MNGAPKPPDEPARLAALERYAILDTEPEPTFDRIAGLVSRILEVPIALVSLVDVERQWFKACIGLPIHETSRDVAFCAHAIHANDVFEIPDATADPRFVDNPLVTGPPFIRAYLGAPLCTPDNQRIGTLCALDSRPREFTPSQIATLVDLAKIVVDELELRRVARGLREAQQQLAELAVTDSLTGLSNRRGLDARLDVLAAEAARGRRFSIAIADIDHFKRVNDSHGHAVGDRVLVAVAHALRDAVRKSDLVARLGGEEFCIVQADVDGELSTMLTERLRVAVAAIGDPVAVTASFGVCHSSTTADPVAMLAAADAALYRAKRAGRDRVVAG